MSDFNVLHTPDNGKVNVTFVMPSISTFELNKMRESGVSEKMIDHAIEVMEEVNAVLGNDDLSYPEFISGLDNVLTAWTDVFDWQVICSRIAVHADACREAGGIMSQSAAHTIAVVESLLSQLDDGEWISEDTMDIVADVFGALWRVYCK